MIVRFVYPVLEDGKIQDEEIVLEMEAIPREGEIVSLNEDDLRSVRYVVHHLESGEGHHVEVTLTLPQIVDTSAGHGTEERAALDQLLSDGVVYFSTEDEYHEAQRLLDAAAPYGAEMSYDSLAITIHLPSRRSDPRRESAALTAVESDLATFSRGEASGELHGTISEMSERAYEADYARLIHDGFVAEQQTIFADDEAAIARWKAEVAEPWWQALRERAEEDGLHIKCDHGWEAALLDYPMAVAQLLSPSGRAYAKLRILGAEKEIEATLLRDWGETLAAARERHPYDLG
jgi:hypothetical protein